MTTLILLFAPALALRGVIAGLDYKAITDALSGQMRALDEVHTANSLVPVDAAAVIVTSVLAAWAAARWRRACHANALSRPEIGMRWVVQVRSGRAYVRARRLQTACYLVILVTGIAIRTPDHYDRQTLENISPLFIVQVAAAFFAVLATIELAVLARRMTRELLAAVDDGDLAERRRTNQPSIA